MPQLRRAKGPASGGAAEAEWVHKLRQFDELDFCSLTCSSFTTCCTFYSAVGPRIKRIQILAQAKVPREQRTHILPDSFRNKNVFLHLETPNQPVRLVVVNGYPIYNTYGTPAILLGR